MLIHTIFLFWYLTVQVFCQNDLDLIDEVNPEDRNDENNELEENFVQEYLDLFLSDPYEPEEEFAVAVEADKESFVPVSPGSGVDLREISRLCPKDGFFASFNRNHSEAVSLLVETFEGMKDGSTTSLEMLAAAAKIKKDPNIHPKLWYTAFLQVELQKRPDESHEVIPAPFYLFPTNFFPAQVLRHNGTEPVLLDERFGADNGVENALWYFREDIPLSAHHWFWHLIYPSNKNFTSSRRRGELFSFFHHDLLARYATERIANGLKPQIGLNLQLNSVIEGGYNPHLTDGISARRWTPRRPRQRVLTAVPFKEELSQFTTNKFRVLEAIVAAQVTRNLSEAGWIPIANTDNINTVGELTESTVNTINPEFYGMTGFHNWGHTIIALINANITDPNNFAMGVMGDNAVTMRDPAFYIWHQYVDDVFTTYKLTHLQPYPLSGGNNSLIVPGIITSSVKVIPDTNENYRSPNVLYTYWNTRRMNVENGLDFRDPATNPNVPPRNVTVDAKHLDHEEFQYEIKIENQRNEPVSGTVRIFMAPRFKSVKAQMHYTMTEQRNFFFAMDSFKTTLSPGINVVNRKSTDSTLTAPWPKSIKEIADELNNNTVSDTKDTKCGCGFPHHLLLPKGTEQGMLFDLFVMVTEEKSTPLQDSTNGTQCIASHIHCGAQGLDYPDDKPMGYPFDRRPFEVPRYVIDPQDANIKIKQFPVGTLEEYVAHIPNSFTTPIVVAHHNVQYGL